MGRASVTLYREVEHWVGEDGVESELVEVGAGAVADVVAALAAIDELGPEYVYHFLVREQNEFVVRATRWSPFINRE